MDEIQGVVEKIIQREKNYGLKLAGDDRWFNGWGVCVAKEGEKVFFNFSSIDKGDKKYFDIEVLNVEGKKESLTQDQAKISVRRLEFSQKDLNLLLASLHCYESTIRDIVAYGGGGVDDLFDDLDVMRRYIQDNIAKVKK